MIALTIILGLTAITCTSLVVANAIDKRMTPPEEIDIRIVAIQEKRRVLERHRAVLLNMATNETNAREDRMARVQDVFNVDKALLALADEEAKL